MMNKRLNIGLLIHHLNNDYSKAVLKGASSAAEELDANLIIYAGRSLNSDLNDKRLAAYEYQNNVIYNFASSKALDGVIISAATVGQFISKEQMYEFVQSFTDMPVLVMENEVKGCPCLRFGSDGIKQVVNHLIGEHGCKRIAFVSGPKSNGDAMSRLNSYAEALMENDIEYDEKLIAYGNFSEFTEELVGKLLDNCGEKPDAICFANDQMCIGGYKAIRARGMTPGKDILVTGYDDSEVAYALDPMLTTVRADASYLGYTAVNKMCRWIKSGVPAESSEISANLVTRGSCGCESGMGVSSRILSMVEGMNIEDSSVAIVNAAAGMDYSRRGIEMRSRLAGFLADIFTVFDSGGEINEGRITAAFNELLESGITDVIGYDTLFSVLDTAQAAAAAGVGAQASRRSRILRIFENLDRAMSEFAMGMYYRVQHDLNAQHFLISNITKDMMLNIDDESKYFASIVDNLSRICMHSTYIYLYENTMANVRDSKWEMPEKLRLKAYHIGNEFCSVPVDAQDIPWYKYIDNEYSPADVRRTMVLAPLYSNEMQYGIALFALDYKDFSQIYSITPQICTAIRIISLVKQLESSLVVAQNTNSMLNRISMIDELTGVYNRRGFYHYANAEIHKPNNFGCKAMVIFADLNNLKKINDTFGHEEGDYAIRIGASLLTGVLRSTDIVARIGGDEYAALAVVRDDMAAGSIQSRIKIMAEEHNRTSDKEYNVTISVGTYVFVCREDTDIRSFMDKADSALYEDKKNKDKNIFKNKTE